MGNSSGDDPPTSLYIDPEAPADSPLQPSANSSLPSSSTPAERRCAVCSCKLPTSSLRSAKSLPAPKHFKFDLRERDDDDDDDDDDNNAPSERGMSRGEEQQAISASSPASASPAAAAPAAPEAEAEAEAGEAEESGGSELDSESVPESGFWTREAVGAADGEGGGRGRLGEEPTGEAELDGAGEAAELLLKGEGDGGLNEGEGEAEALACRAGELSGVEKAESDGEKMEKEEEEEKELQEESAGDA
ncbi:unnamed protein product [Closterium sp. NIES-54]